MEQIISSLSLPSARRVVVNRPELHVLIREADSDQVKFENEPVLLKSLLHSLVNKCSATQVTFALFWLCAVKISLFSSHAFLPPVVFPAFSFQLPRLLELFEKMAARKNQATASKILTADWHQQDIEQIKPPLKLNNFESIFSFLSTKEAVAAQRVCRAWRVLLTDPNRVCWQKIILPNLKHGPDSSRLAEIAALWRNAVHLDFSVNQGSVEELVKALAVECQNVEVMRRLLVLCRFSVSFFILYPITFSPWFLLLPSASSASSASHCSISTCLIAASFHEPLSWLWRTDSSNSRNFS